MLKGTAKIELTDVKTGRKEVVMHDNLVTNAVNDLLTLNPLGMRFHNYYNTSDNTDKTSATDQYDELGSSFETGMLPICPNAIGGVLLYEDALEEDPAKYYAPMDNLLVGYASNDVNETDNDRRGSMNLNESGALEDGAGYRFVFDFTTTQANGTISALGLTSRRGGQAGYGAPQDKVGYPMLAVDGARSWSLKGSDWYSAAPADFYTNGNLVAADFEKNVFYYARVLSPNTIKVGKMRANLSTLNLLGNTRQLNDAESKTITTTAFATVTSTKVTSFSAHAEKAFVGTFIDDGNGYIWGFQHKGNTGGNPSGSASVLWIKISMKDFSHEEGEWTLDAQLYPFGISGYNDVNIAYLYKSFTNFSIIQDGRLYALKYDTNGVYSINLENPSDIEFIECDFSIYAPFRSQYGGAAHHTAVAEIGGVISYLNAYINNGTIYQAGYGTTEAYGPYKGTTSGSISKNKGLTVNSMTHPHCGPFFCTLSFNVQESSSTYYQYRSILSYLMTPYLATINNLDTPVEKTADKTMKITYILREE